MASRIDVQRARTAQAAMEGTKEAPQTIMAGAGMFALGGAMIDFQAKRAAEGSRKWQYLSLPSAHSREMDIAQKPGRSLRQQPLVVAGRRPESYVEIAGYFERAGVDQVELAKTIKKYVATGHIDARFARQARKIDELSVLMFGSESARKGGNPLFSAMALDLTAKRGSGVWLEDALTMHEGRARGGRGFLPMSMQRAEAAAKELQAEREAVKAGETPKKRSRDAQQLAKRELKLAEVWMWRQLKYQEPMFRDRVAAAKFIRERMEQFFALPPESK
jgi:hypothetical protein